MDVQVDRDLIRSEREKRAWSQEHLAGAAGIGARTLQRIEATGIASYESVRALSAALEMPVDELRADAASPATRQVAPARLRFALRWLGTAAMLAMLAGIGGFLLLHDYQKVRVLRTLEQWVTAEVGPAVAQVPIPVREQVQLFNSLPPAQQQALMGELQRNLPPAQGQAILQMLQQGSAAKK